MIEEPLVLEIYGKERRKWEKHAKKHKVDLETMLIDAVDILIEEGIYEDRAYSAKVRAYWDAMTPEEREAEMEKRRRVWREWMKNPRKTEWLDDVITPISHPT